jgi:hypothetical protein
MTKYIGNEFSLTSNPGVKMNPHWVDAPAQFETLTQVLSNRKLKILEPGPWHGHFSEKFVEQGHSVTSVEPWLGDEARFNSLTQLHTQLVVDRRPIEVFLKEDTTSHWDVVFAVGLLYHVPSPLHLLDLFTERADHVYFDTYPWVDTVRLTTPNTSSWATKWDHKNICLVCAPKVLDHYMTVVLKWSRGWQGIQCKVSGHPIWTAYYHRNTVPALSKADVIEYHIDAL